MGLKKTLLILLEDYFVLLLSGMSRIKVDVLRSCSLPKILTVPSASANMNLSPFIGVNTSFAFSLRAWNCDASISFQFFNVCNHHVSFPNLPHPDNTYPRNMPGKTFGPNGCNLDMSFTEIG